MRINRETLTRLTHETIEKRVNQDRSLISIYLCGSFLGEDYLLGGTADIDLVFIHIDDVHDEREIVYMMEDVHLDIAHHTQNLYRTPRALRVHAWLGPTIKDCEILHDPQHFMDFTQASVRGQFNRPDRIYERSRSQLSQARKIWLSHRAGKKDPGPAEILEYLRALGSAVNAVASLSGAPLTERRFLIDFPQRAEALGKPGMVAGLFGLLGAANLESESVADLIPLWRDAYEAVPSENRPARIHPVRRAYYEKAFEAMLDGGQAQAVLWPLMRTWTTAINVSPINATQRMVWDQALEQLGLLGKDFQERIVGLDAFLDLIEETGETWAQRNGVWVE